LDFFTKGRNRMISIKRLARNIVFAFLLGILPSALTADTLSEAGSTSNTLTDEDQQDLSYLEQVSQTGENSLDLETFSDIDDDDDDDDDF